MNKPKISVIVPVYKVESYLPRCLDSIVSQTYENLEIILVDDGSPDSCGAICDEYAAKDHRIVVIHQENGGLSAARNTALDMATGDYIGFVDSDDWIEPDMYEYLLTNALTEQADIAVCGRYEEFPDCTEPRGCPACRVLDRAQALQALLEDQIVHNHVWDKLWKRTLFDGARFPVGYVYEDIAIAYLLFEKADRVLCLPENKYHYLRRQDSIIGMASVENRIDLCMAAKKRYHDLISRWPQLSRCLEAACLQYTSGLWERCAGSCYDVRRRNRKALRELAEFCRPFRRNLLQDPSFGLVGRITIWLAGYDSWWAFSLTKLIRDLYRIKHGKGLL